METFKHLLQMRFVRWAGVALLTLIFLSVFLMPRALHAENQHVVTIYHDGIEQTIVTSASTVADVLKRANVTLNKYDNIEPSLQTKLTAPSYDLNVYRASPVTVIDGTQRYDIMTSHTSAPEIAAAAGLTVRPEDTFDLTRIDNFITDGGVGLKLVIHRAMPVTLTLYGQPSQIYTQAATVGDLLKQKNVKLAAQDGTNLPANAPITPGVTIEVWRNGAQTITVTQDIPFTTQQIRDADQPAGYKQVQKPGQNGKQLVTYQVVMKNGQEVGRQQLQAVVVSQPVAQVEVIGVKLGFSGAFQDALALLRGCEAGGIYTRNSGNGYYGAYQYNISTWANYDGYNRPDLAPPEVQDQKAYLTYQARGWQPWPTCSAKLGLQDIYR